MFYSSILLSLSRLCNTIQHDFVVLDYYQFFHPEAVYDEPDEQTASGKDIKQELWDTSQVNIVTTEKPQKIGHSDTFLLIHEVVHDLTFLLLWKLAELVKHAGRHKFPNIHFQPHFGSS